MEFIIKPHGIRPCHSMLYYILKGIKSSLKKHLQLFLFLSGIFLTLQAQAQKGTVTPNVVQPTDPPGAPGPISGPIQLQSGASSITATYTTTAASGAQNYSWT